MYGSINALIRRAGYPTGTIDVFIASIALVNRLVLVTRNPDDFRHIPALEIATY
jgi:predicted nucleic acid-binding protein